MTSLMVIAGGDNFSVHWVSPQNYLRAATTSLCTIPSGDQGRHGSPPLFRQQIYLKISFKDGKSHCFSLFLIKILWPK